MRESRADTVQAVVLATVLHLLLAALIFIGFGWLRKTAEPAAGAPVVEATMVDAGDLSARMQRVLANRQEAEAAVAEPEPAPLPEALDEADVSPPPPPEPEPAPQAPPPQPASPPPQVKPDTREQEEVRREALNREKREREQEARRRQEQIELQRRQEQQAAEQKRRQAEQQQARERAEREARSKAEAEVKARTEREARAKAEADAKARADREARARALAEARAQQQADAQARAAARNAGAGGNSGAAQGQGRDTRGEWLALVVGEIEKQWRRPEEVPPGQRCPIRIRLLPGGEVLSAEVQASCPYSEANRRSVEAAVMRASPLPLKGNENLAIRDFVVNFYPSR